LNPPEGFFLNPIHGGNIYEIAERYGLKPSAIIDFSSSINPLGLSKKAAKKIQKELSAILNYPDPQCFHLTQALAQFLELKEDQILVGAGSTEFIYAIPRVLKIQRALIVTPAFSEYENALEGTKERAAEIHYFETREEDGFEISVESLLSAMTQGYDALYLCNPNNPTGILTEKKDLLKILAQAERERIWFILDEAFIDFIGRESLIEETASCSRLIILRSLTKFFALPGLRAGYLISNPRVIDCFALDRKRSRPNRWRRILERQSLYQ
jgi:threonine-phosphate decarboxylase